MKLIKCLLKFLSLKLNFGVLLAICMLSQSASVGAQKSLDPGTYKLKVTPVLAGILGDFYQMLTLFPDFPKKIIPLIKELSALEVEKKSLKETCPGNLTKACLASLDSLRLKLTNISSSWIILAQSQKMSPSLYLDNLSGQRLLSEFNKELTQTKGELDNLSFLMAAQIPYRLETHKILKRLDQMKTFTSLALVEFIPFTYRSDFEHFYFNFIRPVEIHISHSQHYDFLKKNEKSLNFALNLLNMRMTKRNKEISKKMKTYLSVIHRRWNHLLRYYL